MVYLNLMSKQLNSNESKKSLHEVHLNLHGKILFSAISAWLLGKEPQLKIKGTKEQMSVFSKTLRALKEFHDEMQDKDSDVSKIMKKLGAKNSAIKSFERVFGIKWPTQL